MIVAELEVRHSRRVAPTRRVALGKLWLPADPPPGLGGVLLGGVVAANVGLLDEELAAGLDALLDDLTAGHRVAQPRLRHRFQVDTHGLDRSRHRLVNVGMSMALEIDDHAGGLAQVLGAVYAAAHLTSTARPAVFRLLRRATRWDGGVDDRLIPFLTGDPAVRARPGVAGDERWARSVLGFDTDGEPGRSEVQRRFRVLVREAHPDHGAASEGAGARIVELTQAKRILLGREATA
ncbi:MAG: hypothetical protein ACRD0F_06705 [Acidimicrobiales bacterium]